jgi:hypothetical protein
MATPKHVVRKLASVALGLTLSAGATMGVIAASPSSAHAASTVKLTSTSNPPDYVSLGYGQVYMEAAPSTSAQKVVFTVRNSVTGAKYSLGDLHAPFRAATTNIPSSACGQAFTAQAVATLTSGSTVSSSVNSFSLHCGPQMIIKPFGYGPGWGG